MLIICRNVERGGEVVEAGDARNARQRDQEEHCRGSFGTYVDTLLWGDEEGSLLMTMIIMGGFCCFLSAMMILFVRIMTMIIMRGMHVNEIKRNIAGATLVHVLILCCGGMKKDPS